MKVYFRCGEVIFCEDYGEFDADKIDSFIEETIKGICKRTGANDAVLTRKTLTVMYNLLVDFEFV